MIKRTTVALAAAALGGGLLAGCGGDDNGGGLSKADLAKKADAICVKYNAQQKALPDPTDEASTIAYFDKLRPITEAQGKELKALKPADDVKATWNGLLAQYDQIAAAADKAQAALKSGNQAAFQSIVKSVDGASKDSDAKLDALGATHCGSQSDN